MKITEIPERIVVGVYIRVSTQEQASEGYSISEQNDRLVKYCQAQNWIVYKVYSDPGFSGGSIERPGLSSLISDVTAGKINKVVVFKLDRLSRSQKDTLYLIEDVFLENNVDFVSMTENFDTGTPLGRAMIGILSVFAQLEREQIKERMAIGREGRAKSGLWRGGGNVPIGYRYNNDNVLRVDPYEAEIVKRIFREYLSGRTITAITSDLRKEKISSSYGLYTRTTVRQILTRATYAGFIEYNGTYYPGDHEAIISQEEWNKTKAKLEESARTDVTHLNFSNRVSPITGLCYCSICGGKMISRYWTKRSTGETFRNITCLNKKKTGCTGGAYPRSEIEEIVLGQIKKLRLDPEFMKKVRSQTETSDNTEKIEILEERIRNNEIRISRYMDLYTLDNIDIMTIKEKIETLSTESESLKCQIETIQKSGSDTMTDTEILDRVERMEYYIDEGDIERTRGIVTSLIKRIDISADTIEITWSF
jgi:site-specific DNA recombinase